MKSSHRLAILALIAASLIWGANAAVMKITLLQVPLFSLAFLRFFTASLLLFPFVHNKLALQRKHVPLVVVSALCGVTFNISLFFMGLRLTTALNAGILSAFLPVLTLFFAHLMLKEPVKKNVVLGALIGLFGMIVIFGKDFMGSSVALSPLGDFLLVLATLSFVFYEILSKKLFKLYNPLVITYYSFLIGGLSFVPIAFLEFVKQPQWIYNLTLPAIGGIVYGIFFSSFAAYSLWQWGASKMPTSRVGFFFYLDPIASTIAAVLLLSETITLPFVIGSAFIFLGLFVAEGRVHHYHLIKSQNK